MSLAGFVRVNLEQIVREWERFAARLSDAPLPKWMLRDHAGAIVEFIAGRMGTPNGPIEQRIVAASEGNGSPAHYIASAHVKVRIDSGFDLAQIVAEYSALRASVTRLWRERDGENFASSGAAAELAKFDEIVDECVMATVADYKQREAQYRDRFIGMLGHDLRSPLNVILLAASGLAQLGLSEEQHRSVGQIERNARQLESMTSDLLDFARGRLGAPMPVRMADVDLGELAGAVVENIQKSFPDCRIEFETSGDSGGRWDRERLEQAVSNLIMNAIQHGTGKKVWVTVAGDGGTVSLQVHNEGPVIPDNLIATMFDPLVQGEGAKRESNGLGLGLFIVNEIVTAHNGAIAVTSTARAGTTFAIRLPRSVS